MKVFLVLLTCLFLTSCATTTDVVQMGPDVYALSANAAPIRGGESGARVMGIAEANKYCASLGKASLITGVTTRPVYIFADAPAAGAADVTFRCLDKSDPSLQAAAPAYLLPPPSQPSQPMPGQPTYGQPMQGQPMPGQPAYGQPMPGQPTYGQPMQGQPMPGQPIFGQPR